jgi:thymidylate synthase (FAD)
MKSCDFVVPPLWEETGTPGAALGAVMGMADRVYEQFVEEATEGGVPRKQAREAARCVMPNCTETKIVVTGNFRAWRGVIESRGSEHADAEIRRLAVAIARILGERFPAVFGDAVFEELPDGETTVRLKYGKV